MHSILESAKWFLRKSGREIERERLQRLCYYSQAWSFSMLSGNPLFMEKFEARAQGPVNHDLCMACGAYDVVPVAAFEGVPDAAFTEDETELLDMVWDIYGSVADHQLGCLVRCEYPWKEARGDLRPEQSCIKEISFENMRRHYLVS